MNDELPPDVGELDRALREVRFEPRLSLGAEIGGRAQRPEPAGDEGQGWRHLGMFAGGVGMLAVVGLGVLWYFAERPEGITLDRCCYDLDGGGKPDDGWHVEAGRGERVRRVAIYEDSDGSVSFTPRDLVRYRSP